jgi:YafQ family addiction module toxin component
MAYSLEVAKKLDKLFGKLAKKDKVTFEAINKKANEILENPHHYKPLKAPMQLLRRVHISNSFVLIFKIDEERKVVQLVEFEHHDKAYN